MTILRKMLQDRTPGGSAEIYEWFSNFYLSKCSTAMQADNHAKLCLYHPKKPDPTPMLELASKVTSARICPQLDAASRDYWFAKYMLRACFLLRLQDRVLDAEWLESYIRKECPNAWRRRDQWFYYTARDPKLQHLLKGKKNASWIPKEFTHQARKKGTLHRKYEPPPLSPSNH